MLRFTLIASLVLFNLSVWVGPMEVLAARGKAMLDPGPRYERAQALALKRDVGGAAKEFAALVALEPDNPTYRLEFGLLCYNNADKVAAAMGWDRATLLNTVVAQMRAARDLTPGDYSASATYALTLMDQEFFGTELPIDVPVEAWSHTLALVEAERSGQPSWEKHHASAAHIHLQLARVMERYGHGDAVPGYLKTALAEEPDLRIPRELRKYR